MDCWTVRECWWTVGSRYGDWFLKFDLKRDSYFVEGELATVMVQLRSRSPDVIGAPEPVEPLATFTRGLQKMFATYEFGPFQFCAYKRDGRVRGNFELRITIWEDQV